MSIFKITINAGPPAKFTPNPQVVFTNDSVFWFNGDTIPHWPAPSTSDPKGYMDFQIAPNSPSSQVGFGSTGTNNYVCVLHPGETGQIVVKTPKAATFGKKTKKGGFAGNTKKGSFAAKTSFASKTKETSFGSKTKKTTYGATTKKGPFGSTKK